MNYKEILNKLPSTWEQLTLKQYIKLSPVLNDADAEELIDDDIYTIKHLSDLDKSIQLISLLTDTTIDAIEELPMVQVSELINKLSFIGTIPQYGKPQIAYKQFDLLTYDNFITFQRLSLDFEETGILSSAVENLPMMLTIFAQRPNHNEEYFLNQSMPEILSGFFLCNRNIEKYLKRLERSLLLSQMKQMGKQIKPVLTRFWQNRKASKVNLIKDGIIG